MDNGSEAVSQAVERWLLDEPAVMSVWRRTGRTLRDLWLTAWRGRPEKLYTKRTLRLIASGKLRETLGLEVHDETLTRSKSELWLAQLIALGLRPDHLCVEYGCGSLWCAEPFIRHLQPGRFIGFDVTDEFYAFGRQRLGALLDEKQVRLAVISRRSLNEVAAMNPDFVFSHRVLHHVPPHGLARYMRKICALLGERTLLVIENMPRSRRGSQLLAARYGLDDIQPHLPKDWTCQVYPFGFVIRNRSADRSPL
jgi:hypothetical protein